jgi:hypothetical protein
VSVCASPHLSQCLKILRLYYCVWRYDIDIVVLIIGDVIVILDSSVKDISAQQIVNRKPDFQIIFTTTLPWDSIKPAGINNNSKILLKPFKFSELLSLQI